MQEKEVGGDLATRFLESSYQPGSELVGMMQPSLNLANMATTAGQQLGGYSRDLAGQELKYDLGTEQMSADIQREALNSIFGLLMNEQTNKGNVASAANAAAGRTGASTTFGYNPNNPNHDPYKPWTWI